MPQSLSSSAAALRGLRPYRRGLFLSALAVITLLAYRPVWHGTQLMDDDAYVISKPELRSLSGLAKIWMEPQTAPQGQPRQYHPLVNTVFWIGDKIWGEAMTGYHLLNIFFHIAAALLLWKILRQLEIPGGWLATAIFALHPVQVDSVAWVAEIKNTLSAVFFFASIAAYLRFDQTRAPKAYFLSLAIFVTGLLAKGTVAMAAIVLPIIFWWKRGRLNGKNDLLPLLPFAALGMVAGIATAWMERAFSGAEGDAFAFSFLDRLLIAGRALWFYASKAIWPANLLFVYPRWEPDPHLWWQYLFPAAAIAIFAIAWVLRKDQRGLFAGLLIFVLLLSPFIGFFNLVFFRLSFVSDHFQYLAILGLIIPLSAGAETRLKVLPGKTRIAGWALVMAVLAALCAVTLQHSWAYRDYQTSCDTVIKQNPHHWLSQAFRAGQLMREGELAQALVHWKTALKRSPADLIIRRELLRSVGDVHSKMGQLDEAIRHFEQALATSPDFPEAHHDLGNALRRKGRYQDAVLHYESALRLDSNAILTMNNLGWLLATCSDPSVRSGARAVAVARKAELLTGSADPMVLHTLAAAYAENGQFNQAIEAAERALQLAQRQQKEILLRALPYELSLYRSGLPFHEPSR